LYLISIQWTELEQKFEGNDKAAIFDVDCTAAGKEVCTKMGVRGYPTIHYFAPGKKEGEKYQSGRDLDSLTNFMNGKVPQAEEHDEL